jgi:hypothetical protein
MGMEDMNGQMYDACSYPSFEANGHSKYHTAKRLAKRMHFLTTGLSSHTAKSEYIRVFFREWCYILQIRQLDDNLLLKKVVQTSMQELVQVQSLTSHIIIQQQGPSPD